MPGNANAPAVGRGGFASEESETPSFKPGALTAELRSASRAAGVEPATTRSHMRRKPSHGLTITRRKAES